MKSCCFWGLLAGGCFGFCFLANARKKVQFQLQSLDLRRSPNDSTPLPQVHVIFAPFPWLDDYLHLFRIQNTSNSLKCSHKLVHSVTFSSPLAIWHLLCGSHCTRPVQLNSCPPRKFSKVFLLEDWAVSGWQNTFRNLLKGEGLVSKEAQVSLNSFSYLFLTPFSHFKKAEVLANNTLAQPFSKFRNLDKGGRKTFSLSSMNKSRIKSHSDEGYMRSMCTKPSLHILWCSFSMLIGTAHVGKFYNFFCQPWCWRSQET